MAPRGHTGPVVIEPRRPLPACACKSVPYRRGAPSAERFQQMHLARVAPAPRSLTRRRTIGAVSTAAVGLLAGCQSLPFSEPEVATGHLFVQNRDDRQIEVALSVVERDGGDRPVYGRYVVPADTALQFEEILAAGATYRVAARQPGLEDRPGQTLEARTETCEEGDPAGKVDVAISVSSDGPEISVFNCQTPYTRTGELTYVAADENRLGTPSGPVASPTPSDG